MRTFYIQTHITTSTVYGDSWNGDGKVQGSEKTDRPKNDQAQKRKAGSCGPFARKIPWRLRLVAPVIRADEQQ